MSDNFNALVINQEGEKFSREIMSLPSYPLLTNEQVEVIAECVNKVIN